MPTPGINVIARFKAKVGQADRVRQALLDMIEPTLAEHPNIGYALHVSTDDPNQFFLYEQWQDKAGLDAHMKQPYFANMEQQLDGALETPMEVITASLIGGSTEATASTIATTA